MKYSFWYIRKGMCACFWRGEDRLAKNRETCHKGKVISYHAVSEEWFLLSSLALPSLEQLIEKEQILELMGLLTERQRDIVILYFYYGETQWEIAKELGITQLQFLRRCDSTSPDAGQSEERQSLWKESGF